jgi:hypothetical protein
VLEEPYGIALVGIFDLRHRKEENSTYTRIFTQGNVMICALHQILGCSRLRMCGNKKYVQNLYLK